MRGTATFQLERERALRLIGARPKLSLGCGGRNHLHLVHELSELPSPETYGSVFKDALRSNFPGAPLNLRCGTLRREAIYTLAAIEDSTAGRDLFGTSSKLLHCHLRPANLRFDFCVHKSQTRRHSRANSQSSGS